MKKSRNYLTGQAFACYALWQVVGIVGVLFPPLLSAYAIGMVLFFLLLAADYRTLLPDNSFEGEIDGPGTPEMGSTFTLHGTIRLTLEKTLRSRALSVQAPIAERLVFQSKRWRTTNKNAAANEVPLEISAYAYSLGYEVISSVHVLAKSKTGFWLKALPVNLAPYSFRVSPQLKKMPEETFTEMVANQRLLFQGSRLLMRGRTVDQFHSIRKYHYPDSIRHLDHKKTAKFGQLMTRTYESYHSHHMILALDVGRPMLGRIRNSPKHDFYLSASLALAQAAISAGDRVSFLAFSQTPHVQISKVRSMKAFLPVFRGTTAVQPREEDSNYAVLNRCIADATGQRAIVLLLTDLSHPFVQTALLQHVPALCRSHLTVVLSLLDRSYDLATRVNEFGGKTFAKPDFAKLLYSYWINQQLELFTRKLSRFGGGALTISEEYWMKSAIRVYSLLRSSMKA